MLCWRVHLSIVHLDLKALLTAIVPYIRLRLAEGPRIIREALDLQDRGQGMRPVVLLFLTIKSLCIPRNIKIRCRCIEIRL
jgi:hypothetical protein